MSVCAYCGKEFEPNRPWVEQRFCTQWCARRHYNETRSKPPRTVTCEVCGKVFETRHGRKKTCSDECKKKLNCKQTSQRLTEQTEPLGRTTRVCHDCGKPCTNYRCEKCWQLIRKNSFD